MTTNRIVYVEMDDHVEGIMPDGQVFLIDKEDLEAVQTRHWHICGRYLRSTSVGLMHRFLMQSVLQEGQEVDHINRNRLDNRKSNLRCVTRLENMQNKSLYKNNTSGHHGIKWNTRLNKWQAQITKGGQRSHLGVYSSYQDAVLARKRAEASNR